MAVIRRCRGCGKLIEVERGSTRWHCDAVCRKRAERRRKREHSGPRRRAVPVMVYAGICAACGEQMFSSRPHQKEFCSPACRQWAYRQRKAETVYQLVIEEGQN